MESLSVRFPFSHFRPAHLLNCNSTIKKRMPDEDVALAIHISWSLHDIHTWRTFLVPKLSFFTLFWVLLAVEEKVSSILGFQVVSHNKSKNFIWFSLSSTFALGVASPFGVFSFSSGFQHIQYSIFYGGAMFSVVYMLCFCDYKIWRIYSHCLNHVVFIWVSVIYMLPMPRFFHSSVFS